MFLGIKNISKNVAENPSKRSTSFSLLQMVERFESLPIAPETRLAKSTDLLKSALPSRKREAPPQALRRPFCRYTAPLQSVWSENQNHKLLSVKVEKS